MILKKSLKDKQTDIINIHNITDDDALKILTNEFVKIQNEIYISQLIDRYHDSEDLFEKNIPMLEEKKDNIRIAIKNLKNRVIFGYSSDY
jgi:hypothetical protein